MELFSRQADYKTAAWSFYRYLPSEAAAIAFIVLFALATAFHLWRLFRTRTWFFIPFCIGGMLEAIGYAGRAVNATESPNWHLTPYIIQSLLILISPALFAASMYMMLGRIIVMVDGERHSIIRRRWLTKIFVAGDVACFFTQGAGGGIQAQGGTHPSDVQLGEHVILAGLLIQVVFFALFIITAGIFDLRLRQAPTTKSQQVPWRSHMNVLYVTNTLIMVRSVFRVIEYAMGNDGFLLRHEPFLYVFDSALMLLVMLAYIWKYPSEISDILREGRDAERGYGMGENSRHSNRIRSGGPESRSNTPNGTPKRSQWTPV